MHRYLLQILRHFSSKMTSWPALGKVLNGIPFRAKMADTSQLQCSVLPRLSACTGASCGMADAPVMCASTLRFVCQSKHLRGWQWRRIRLDVWTEQGEQCFGHARACYVRSALPSQCSGNQSILEETRIASQSEDAASYCNDCRLILL